MSGAPSRRSAAFYSTTRALFRMIARPMFRFRVDGAGEVPDEGPLVVVARHRSWLDPACVGGAMPRPVRFLIARNIYDKWWARWFYRRMGSLPVAPGGSASLLSLREALRELERGGVIGVFPEGRVVSAHAGGPMHEGAALLAVRAQSPVVPIVIRGSERAWPHGRRWPGPARVELRIEPPLQPPPKGDRTAVTEMTDRIAEALSP